MISQAFLSSPWLQDPHAGEDRRQLLLFLVACSFLARASEPALKLLLLRTVRDTFFADQEIWRSSLPLKDVSNAQDEIFRSKNPLYPPMSLILQNFLHIVQPSSVRLFYIEGLEKSQPRLTSLLLSLRQDKSLRAALDPAYTEFVKTPRLHPKPNVMQQCILSLL